MFVTFDVRSLALRCFCIQDLLALHSRRVFARPATFSTIGARYYGFVGGDGAACNGRVVAHAVFAAKHAYQQAVYRQVYI
jgi:hypothetical protein